LLFEHDQISYNYVWLGNGERIRGIKIGGNVRFDPVYICPVGSRNKFGMTGSGEPTPSPCSPYIPAE